MLLDETPPFGCPTHLHLAASAGLGFAELLGELKRAARAGDTISAAHLSRALRFAGPFDETLAEYIMWACDTKYERSQQGTFQCRYALALTELIKLKCDMSPDSFGLDVRRHNRRQSCPACVEAYFSELDKRLQLLKSIGLECLSPDQVTAFKLDEGKLLVQHTYSVIEALEELSVPIPRHVRTSCNLLPSSSIWMVRSLTMQLLAIFFKAGLQDRAEPFERGCIALEQLIEELASYRRTYMGKSQTKEIYSKMIWILEHSPGDILERPWQYHHRGLGHVSCSLCRLVDLGHKPTIGHALAVVLGQSLGSLEAEAEADEDWWDDWYLRDHWQLLTNKVLHMSISDRSSCLCSKMGREPFDLLWREFVGPITDNNSPSVLALEIHDFAQAYGHGLRFRHLRAAVRYLTFEVLSLQHTCGRILDEDRLDEAEELVNDQQRTQLFHEIQEWLDEILVEELGSRHGSEASDDSKARRSVASDKGEDDQPRSSRSVDDEGLSSISASSKHTDSSESDSSDVSISEDTWLDLLFTWGDRMELELEGMFLQSVRENHTQAAENIGVSWCRPPPKVEPEESFSPPYGSKEYWLLTLEKIWPERKA